MVVNIVSAALILIFITPILTGVFKKLTLERFHLALGSILYNVEFIVTLILSIVLIKNIFFEHDNEIFNSIYTQIPENLRKALTGNDILVYIIFTPLLLGIITIPVRAITNIIYKKILAPVSATLYNILNNTNVFIQKMFCIVWHLPRATFFVIVVSLALNFFTYYYPVPYIMQDMNTSLPYKIVYNTTIYPILNSNIAKEIPVLARDSFTNNNKPSIADDIKESLGVIEYFNGVTLDEAIKSTKEIDAMAKKIVGSEKNTTKKAKKLYTWVSKNITYDYKKAELINANSMNIDSGAKVCFESRKGICFDYSSLYIAMCRAVGLKVQLITGLGYSGVSWGDHAWNRVQSVEENRWINVDTTFGSTAGYYFDKPDFNVDHRDAEIQEEW